MALANVATSACTFSLSQSSGNVLFPGDPNGFSYNKNLSSKVKIGANFVSRNAISWGVGSNVCAHNDGFWSYYNYGGGSGSMTAATAKAKVDTYNPCRQGLSGTCNCVMYLYYFGFSPAYNAYCTIAIASAGQTKVQAQ